MKTIKQLAEELCISKQAIFKRIDALGCRSKLEMVGGQYQVNPDLERIIRDYASTVNQTVDVNLEEVGCRQSTVNHQPSTINRQPTARLVDTINSQIEEKNKHIEEQRELINSLQKELEEKNSEISELKIIEALYEKLKEEVESLKADKSDLQKHRDHLTTALTVSKSDLARLESIVTQLAALPLRTRVFGWSEAVAQLTTISSEDEIIAEYETKGE